MPRISVDPTIHFGKPCVAGTRIAVQDVLDLVDAGIPFAAMISDYYPALTIADIQACVQYAQASASSAAAFRGRVSN